MKDPLKSPWVRILLDDKTKEEEIRKAKEADAFREPFRRGEPLEAEWIIIED